MRRHELPVGLMISISQMANTAVGLILKHLEENDVIGEDDIYEDLPEELHGYIYGMGVRVADIATKGEKQ